MFCHHAFVCGDFAGTGAFETPRDCVGEPDAFGQRIKHGGGKEHAGRAAGTETDPTQANRRVAILIKDKAK